MFQPLDQSRSTLVKAGLLMMAVALYLICGGTLRDRAKNSWGSTVANGAASREYSAKEFPICFRVLEGSLSLLAAVCFYSAYKKGKDQAR